MVTHAKIHICIDISTILCIYINVYIFLYMQFFLYNAYVIYIYVCICFLFLSSLYCTNRLKKARQRETAETDEQIG